MKSQKNGVEKMNLRGIYKTGFDLPGPKVQDFPVLAAPEQQVIEQLSFVCRDYPAGGFKFVDGKASHH